MKYEKKMLKDIYESTNGLFAFTFYSRYRVEPEQLFKFIEKYVSKEIINYVDDKIYITNKGKDKILKNKLNISTSNNKFAKIPIEFLANKIEVNDPYIPNIKDLPEEIK